MARRGVPSLVLDERRQWRLEEQVTLQRSAGATVAFCLVQPLPRFGRGQRKPARTSNPAYRVPSKNRGTADALMLLVGYVRSGHLTNNRGLTFESFVQDTEALLT